MKRLGLIFTLFTIAFLFTQCRDDHDGCTGGVYISDATGFTSIYTRFAGTSSEPSILFQPEFLFAKELSTKFGFIQSAYACAVSYGETPLNNLIDSIHVISKPEYSYKSLVELIEYDVSYDEIGTIAGYNNSVYRDFKFSDGGSKYLWLNDKPTQSDSFTFSFYYYKDGAIIDSSFTQKYYISE